MPTRGTTSTEIALPPSLADFNPRAYARHDLPPLFRLHQARFQSTCLREARRVLAVLQRRHQPFQSTCLREARPAGIRHRYTPSYFNPRAYARHDLRDTPRSRSASISIHVPTRGTTSRGIAVCPPGRFQSTCLREARPTHAALLIIQVVFQSTCLREARHGRPGRNGRLRISIHVPTRGTTPIFGSFTVPC